MVCLGVQSSAFDIEFNEHEEFEQNENFDPTDVISMAEAYYTRDLDYKVEPSVKIIESLKKLSYYNINECETQKQFIKKKIISMIKNNQYSNSNTFEELEKKVIQTEEFENFQKIQAKRLERACCLSKFISLANLFEFYSSLTVDELTYLGY